MKVLLFRVSEEPAIVEIDGELKSMQELVGGYIETMPLRAYSDDESLVLICNEDGKWKDFKINAMVMDAYKQTVDFIYADFFICRSFEDEFVGIEDDDIPIAMQYIKR